MASPMPVLPEVPSMMVPPGLSSPARSASSIILTAMRSLIELPGLNVSTFARTVPLTPLVMRLIRTIGVLPIASRIFARGFVTGKVYNEPRAFGVMLSQVFERPPDRRHDIRRQLVTERLREFSSGIRRGYRRQPTGRSLLIAPD